VIPLFAAMEQSALSVWMRDDLYAYFVALIFHSVGMALLVGGGVAIGLRGLGFARGAALTAFRGFRPVMATGAVLAVVSGLLLLAAYPAKALTNPLFAVKFACLAGAVWAVRRLLAGGDADPATAVPLRRVAILALLLWWGTVAAGKLLLHTYTVLTVS
jgi:hypothetical protein